MKLGDRVKQRRKELGMSRPELCEKTGMPHPTLVALEERPQNSSKFTEEVAEALSVSVAWLLTGIEPMLAASSVVPSQNVVAVQNGKHEDTHRQISRYDVKLSAGAGTAEWIVRENDDDPIVFRKGWFKARRLYAENLRGMYVRGDSMEDYLFDKDTVLIDIEDTEIIDGEKYALVFKDKFYVKELCETDGEVLIISKNKKYLPMQTNKDEAAKYNNYFQVLGRVVWRGG